MVLDARKIDTEYIDVAADEQAKEKMRKLMGDPKGLPPQIFNEDQYCGVHTHMHTHTQTNPPGFKQITFGLFLLQGFRAFDDACEDDSLDEFLKLK